MASLPMDYEDILRLARRLDPAQQLRLLEALAGSVRQQIAPHPRRRILELQGLGKEIWLGVDAQAYVRQERATWGG